MNKEQIEADNFFKDKYSDSAYKNCFSRYDMVSFAKDYLESKREEIERKAYEAGVANEIAWNKYGIFEPYDYWKKKNKEQ